MKFNCTAAYNGDIPTETSFFYVSGCLRYEDIRSGKGTFMIQSISECGFIYVSQHLQSVTYNMIWGGKKVTLEPAIIMIWLGEANTSVMHTLAILDTFTFLVYHLVYV